MKCSVFALALCSATIFPAKTTAGSSNSDFMLILKYQPPQKAEAIVENSVNLDESSELKTAVSGLIGLYRALLSSQDARVCNYSPSCSHFTSSVIGKSGIIKGTLLGADRLLRCHRWTKRQFMKINKLTPEQVPPRLDDLPESYLR